MTEDSKHIALVPSEKIIAEAQKRAEAKSARKGEPAFHMSDDMLRLSTPWPVCLARAGQIDAADLPAGVILDAAAGSGAQLMALASVLSRPAFGIELEGNIAVMCAANMHRIALDEEESRTLDRVIIGDGSDADGAITTYWNSLRETGIRAHPPIAMLHLDPARPHDAQNHHLDEMQPPIGTLLSSWKEFLQTGPRGPAILLDLSPRLGDDQQSMVDAIAAMAFPGVSKTWEWLSQGGGRVDRLSLWIGAISSEHTHRCVRMGRKNIHAIIEGNPKPSNQVKLTSPPPYGAYISIIDPALLQSGLQENWITAAIPKDTGYSWIRTEGRRPLLIHTETLIDDPNVMGFVVASGKVSQHRLSPPELHSIDQIASGVARHDIGKVILRCNLDPKIQPTIQRRLDKALKEIDGSKAFMIDIMMSRGAGSHTLYVVCKED